LRSVFPTKIQQNAKNPTEIQQSEKTQQKTQLKSNKKTQLKSNNMKTQHPTRAALLGCRPQGYG